ncbi:MAG: HisA/HisF-related TIM barrel protein [Spirochaetaceae bacterium]|nr:HisA/HisF-related TIM barrel protein [Spirochaetaceae bacterium]
MLILPAIDLLDGRPVRLTRGDFDAVTDYARDAAGSAVELQRKGARWLHLVDLDAARGSGDNRTLIAAIRAEVGVRLQVGGGVRTLDDARRLLDMGVDRVVVGSALAQDPELPERWAAQVGDRLVAGIDADDGVVKTHGWLTGGGVADTDLAARMRTQPVCAIVYTNIARDGTFAGPDIERTVAVARSARKPVILSGGIGGAHDVDAAAGLRAEGVVGVIIGKAWIEGRVDLSDLLRRYPQDDAGAGGHTETAGGERRPAQ